MKIVLQGNDWSELGNIEKLIDQLKEFETEENTNQDLQQNLKYALLDYFGRYIRTPGDQISAFNLGVYQTNTNNKTEWNEVLRSTQYIGIVPLLKIENTDKNVMKEEMPVIKISSRFNISPTEMLKAVLSGNDYYENPDMLQTKSYSVTEWRNLVWNKENEKVVCGIINGIGNIELFAPGRGESLNGSKTDVGLINDYGVFEIIDFVNKAKIVCKKNLKRQSQRVEENLNCKVKGRILIQKQIKYNISRGQDQKTYCSYNKMSDDIRENQIIKYALHLCQKNHEIGDALEEDIRLCLNTLSGVPLKKCSAADFVGLKNNGAFRQYKDALLSAKKVIERYCLSYSDASADGGAESEPKIQLSSGKVLPYFIDMNLLFEFYCRAIFRNAIDDYNKNNEEIQFALESTTRARRMLFSKEQGDDGDIHRFFMRTYIPDIVVTYKCKTEEDPEEKIAAVFDAKYSDVEQMNMAKRERTHQILFYMKALGCEFGGLISPNKKNEKTPFSATININHSYIQENSASWKNKGESKLFYIPLWEEEPQNAFQKYSESVKEVLEDISKKITEEIGKQKKAKKKQKSLDELYKLAEEMSKSTRISAGQKENLNKQLEKVKAYD